MGKNNKAGSKHLTERIEDSGLTVTQERVAMGLAMGKPVAEISREVEVPSSTIYMWRQQAAFSTYYKRLQREVVREIRGQLAELRDTALDTLKEMLDGAGEQTRLKAACYILDYMTGDQRENKRMRLKAQAVAKNEKK
jgi:transposase-like protein